MVREPAFKKWFGDWINDPENSSKVVDVNGEPMVVYHGTNSEFYIFSEEIERRGFSDYGFFFTSDPIIAESYTLGSNQSVETIKSGEAYGENANIMALFLNIRNPKIIDAQNTEFFRIGYKMETINVDRIIPTKSLYIQKNDFSNEWLIRDIKYGNTIFESENEELVNKQLQKLKKQKEIIFSDEFEIPSDLSQRGTHINEYVFDLKKSEKHDGLIMKNIKDTGSPLPKIFGHSGIATTFVVKESVQIKSALFNKTFDGNNPDIRFADGGYLRPFTDDGNKLVVYKTKDYKIAVDNVDKARYVTLWFVNSLYDLDVKVGSLALYETEDGFLKVQEIDIQKQHRGKGLSKVMYLMALKYSSDNVKGIKSYLPDRVNKKQIPKIYKKLNAKNDGDWSYILKSDNLNNFKSGGRTIAQTPAPKKDQIYGSDKNKEGSAKDTSSAKQIKFSDDVLEKIQNSVDKHNKKHPNKKITIDSAKAVVRRGMGAYSSTHRPTISGGNENSRVAWGLARLNAFTYKIVNGKSKSGKYSQDNDLIEELGYKVQKYSDGGDIQAYEEALGISEFAEGGEAKPKKVYVSITLDNEIEGNFPDYFWKYDEKTFEDLQNGKLIGVLGVSSSPHNVGEWFVHRSCLIVMKYDEFVKVNDFTVIDYDNPEQLMADDMKLFNRLYANKRDENTDEESIKGQRRNILQNVFKKFKKPLEILIKKEPNLLRKQGLYRIEHFLDESYRFIDWIVKNNNILNNSEDLAEKIIEYHYSDDSSYISTFYGNTEDKKIDKKYILPFVIEMIKSAGNVYKSEQEIYLNNKTLNIPKDSQLFFKKEKDQKSNLLELIDKYKLNEKYRIYFVQYKDIERYSLLASQKRINKAQEKFDSDKKELEIKKDAVVLELLYFFLGESLKSFKEIIEKEIAEYSDSTLFYYDYDEEQKQIDWYGIPLIQLIVNKYIEIIQNNWKKWISSQNVKNITIHSFSSFQRDSHYDLVKYFEENKSELEKINDYHNINGNWLSEYRIEYWLKKSVDDYQDMPEWIDYKELAKMYLEKMDAQMYRYYSEEEIPLFSKYNNGGETDEEEFSIEELDKDLKEVYQIRAFKKIGGFDFFFSRLNIYPQQNVFTIELPSGIEIGRATLNEEENYLINIRIDENYRRKGLGLNLYNFIEYVTGKKLKPSPIKISQEAQGLWSKRNADIIFKDGGQTQELNLTKNKKMENEILIVDMNMYLYNTSVNFKNKEIPLKLNPPKNEVQFMEWAEENNIEFEQWGDVDIIDSSWGYVFEVPLHKYIEYMKTEKFYTGGELKKGIKTEMEHKNTLSKIKTGKFSVEEGATMIAKDHLEENNKYYTHLEKMESEFEEGGWVQKPVKIKPDVYKFEDKQGVGYIVKRGVGERITPVWVVSNDKEGTWDGMNQYFYTLKEAVRYIESFFDIKTFSLSNKQKMAEGGKVQSIHSEKGDIKVSLDENWYSDDSSVELVPVSELIKFREFDRKVNPKYNKENSLENINHLKYMFQKDGVKSPIIIEYSADDNAVLIIEGNHRLNSAIDLGMEYLPARVVLKKYGNYSPLKLKNTMKVGGIKANSHNYIPSDLKPSQVGIAGAKPIVYAEGGIIEGRLHSECGEDGCGRKFQVGENGHIIEAERDEAVIVADAFDNNNQMTVKGTPSEIASALNVIGGGKNFDKGAKIIEGGAEKELPEMKQQATNTDVDDVIDSGSIIINRRSMADEKEYKVTGTPKQIASAINSINGNGVVIEKGAKIE